VPSGGQPRLFGIFEMIHRLGLPRTSVEPIYFGYFASLYDALSESYDWDLDVIVERALACPGPVLELGCGSGRVAIALARAGCAVVGVDHSPDMLALCRRRIARESPEVAARIRLVRADMREIFLPERFGLVVLPANNISLLPTDADRQTVLRAAQRHLAPGGCFLFDSVVLDPDVLLLQNGDLTAFPVSSAAETQFVLAAHRWYPQEQVQVMNFYVESVAPDGTTHRKLGWRTKTVIPEDVLLCELAQARLVVNRCVLRQLNDDRRRVRIYDCSAC